MATVPKSTRSTEITLASATAGPFSLGFRLFDTDAIDIYVNGLRVMAWTLTASFANGFSDTATITFPAALAIGTVIRMDGAQVPDREDDYVNGDPDLTEKLNIELARIWAVLSEIRRDTYRSVRGFAPIDPISGIDPVVLIEAETIADRAEAAASEAEASAAAALAAENSLLEWAGPWVTGAQYAPSDIVQQNGNAYVCILPHTAGVFATDLAANRWQLFVEKPVSGAGDMLSANDLGDVASVPNAVANLGLDQAAKKNVVNTFAEDQTFQKSILRTNPPTFTDANTLRNDTLFYVPGNGTGLPIPGVPYLIENIRQSSGVYLQYAHGVSSPELWYRIYVSGAWTAWSTISVGRPNAHESIKYVAATDLTEVLLTDWADDARYVGYQVLISEGVLSSDGASLHIQLSGDNGATWISSAAAYRYRAARHGATDILNTSSAAIRLSNAGIGAAAGEGFGFTIDLISSDRSTRRTALGWDGVLMDTAGASEREAGSASRLGAGITNGIRIFPTAGTFTAKVTVIGLRGF